MPLDRRTLLQILPAAAFAGKLSAQHDHCGNALAAESHHGPYQFQFFTPEEATLVDTLMEQLIPADEHSLGAHAARVVEFADCMLSASEDYVQRDWRRALTLIADRAQKISTTDWLARASRNEADPQTLEEIFFRTFKQMTLNGYYSSSTGIHDDLHYQGNTYVQRFEGCDHPEHLG